MPTALQKSAFIDRIHGLIEGWFMPRVSRNTPPKTYGFKGDFFSEVLHEVRVDLRYADFVTQHLVLAECEDMRDNKAIARLAEGYLKLLFPDLNVTEEEKARIDPLDPSRKPDECTVEISEGQRGISFEKLFLPYLKVAKEVRIYDPYVRLQYQVFNLTSFCEILEPQESPIRVSLVTSTLSDLKKGLSLDDIEFDFTFDPNLHDRWIETDTGWRITLGRGLDIFQKPDDKFTLGFMDQTKRKCKATSVVYTHARSDRQGYNPGRWCGGTAGRNRSPCDTSASPNEPGRGSPSAPSPPSDG